MHRTPLLSRYSIGVFIILHISLAFGLILLRFCPAPVTQVFAWLGWLLLVRSSSLLYVLVLCIFGMPLP